jgi:hypothetical protein
MTHCFSKTDKHKLQRWESKLSTAKTAQQALEKWLFIHAAGVLFAEKPGELLIIKKKLSGLTSAKIQEIIESFCSSWNLEHKLLNDHGKSLKIIIYNTPAVNRRLSSASKKILHCVLKYPFGLNSETFLAEITRRWQTSGSIPHEIGIALGYPMKDVWGFMGITSDPCSGTCGWRIFGNPESSIRKKARYQSARILASQYLEAA